MAHDSSNPHGECAHTEQRASVGDACAGSWSTARRCLKQARMQRVQKPRAARPAAPSDRLGRIGRMAREMASSSLPRLVANLAVAPSLSSGEVANRPHSPGKSSSRAFRRYAGDLQSPTDGRGARSRAQDERCRSKSLQNAGYEHSRVKRIVVETRTYHTNISMYQSRRRETTYTIKTWIRVYPPCYFVLEFR